MKKSTVKRIITSVLAAATVVSSAVLFTGCGKSKEEQAMDALNSFGNELMQEAQSYADKVSVPTTRKEKARVDLRDFCEKIVSDKLYTVVFDAEALADHPKPKFCLKINDTVEADGYTFTKLDDEKKKEYGDQFDADWEISKNGVKQATMKMVTEWNSLQKPKVFRLVSWIVSKDNYTEEADTDFVKCDDNFEIDVPAALTEAEARQHLAELEKLINENAPFADYKDVDMKLEGIYYYTGNQGEELVCGLYSKYLFNGTDIRDYLTVEGKYPFMDGGEVKTFSWETNNKGTNAPSMSDWIKLK